MNRLQLAFALLRKGRLDTILSSFLKIMGIRNVFLPYPFLLMIEPTNTCNLHCPACPTGSGKLMRPKRMMSFEEFKKIIDEVRRYVININLWNYGEPFLNRELPDMIQYAESNSIKVSVSTNGEALTSRAYCIKVIESGLQHLIVCLDGADQETLAKYRRGSNFNNVLNNIRLIIETKKEVGSQIPKIELQFMLMKHNQHQRAHMRRLASQLGVDIYSEKTIRIDYHDPDFKKMADKLLPGDLSLSRYGLKSDKTYALLGDIPNYCSSIFQSCVINSDGTIVPCCYDIYSEYPMGNIFEEGFEKIWRGNKFKLLRARIAKDRKSIPLCSACSERRVRTFRRLSLK